MKRSMCGSAPSLSAFQVALHRFEFTILCCICETAWLIWLAGPHTLPAAVQNFEAQSLATAACGVMQCGSQLAQQKYATQSGSKTRLVIDNEILFLFSCMQSRAPHDKALLESSHAASMIAVPQAQPQPRERERTMIWRGTVYAIYCYLFPAP